MFEIRERRYLSEDIGRYMKMAKLNLPVIERPLPAAKSLSMDAYLRFVSFNIKFTFNKKAYRNWKKISAVNVPFVLKETPYINFPNQSGNRGRGKLNA